jgi:hypothetical protein
MNTHRIHIIHIDKLLILLDTKERQMRDKPTSQMTTFTFERHFNTKRTLVIDLSIGNGEKDTVAGTKEHRERVTVLRVSLKKQKLSTPSFKASEGQKIG